MYIPFFAVVNIQNLKLLGMTDFSFYLFHESSPELKCGIKEFHTLTIG